MPRLLNLAASGLRLHVKCQQWQTSHNRTKSTHMPTHFPETQKWQQQSKGYGIYVFSELFTNSFKTAGTTTGGQRRWVSWSDVANTPNHLSREFLLPLLLCLSFIQMSKHTLADVWKICLWKRSVFNFQSLSPYCISFSLLYNSCRISGRI